MPPVMFSVVTKYHKGRHSLFLYNSEIFYAFTQDILRSQNLQKGFTAYECLSGTVADDCVRLISRNHSQRQKEVTKSRPV